MQQHQVDLSPHPLLSQHRRPHVHHAGSLQQHAADLGIAPFQVCRRGMEAAIVAGVAFHRTDRRFEDAGEFRSADDRGDHILHRAQALHPMVDHRLILGLPVQ